MLESGTKIGQYKVLRLLAKNDTSEVYLVFCDALQSQLALKLHCEHADAASLDLSAPSASSASKLSTELFTQQAMLMHEFANESHISKVMHIGITHINEIETPYIIMPVYVQNMAQLLALHDQRLPFLTSLSYIKPLFQALVSLHRKGILHLDIKPQNIFIDASSHCFLGDFDNALILPTSPLYQKYIVAYDLPNATHMTAEYASPEQKHYCHLASKDNRAKLSEKSDLFSVGAVWFRMMTGRLYQGDNDNEIKSAFDQQGRDGFVPAWVINLVCELLNDDPYKRPISAQKCLSLIIEAEKTSEQYATQDSSDNMLFSEVSLQLKQEITSLLMTHGEIRELDLKHLIARYMQENNRNTLVHNQEDHHALQGFIDEIQKELIASHNLSAWFSWINYINILLENKGKHLSRIEYHQVLQVGRSGRSDDPKRAVAAMQERFTAPVVSLRSFKMFIPALVIIGVFYYWYMASQSPISVSQEQPVGSELDKKNSADEHYSLSDAANNRPVPMGNADNVDTQYTAQELWKENNHANNTNETEQLAKEDEPLSVLQKIMNNETVMLSIKSERTQTLEASFAFKKPFTEATFAVTLAEISNALYSVCIADGDCRKRKRYSTEAANDKNLAPDHPVINVSWHDVSEEFIPWITRRTGLSFSMVTLTHWQAITARSVTAQASPVNSKQVHCKDCAHQYHYAYQSSTVPIYALRADEQGLYGVFGNVQEWLQNCWVINSIERCDQAMVVGGSWITKRASMHQNAVSQLLKRATSPTTGFRLILELDE